MKKLNFVILICLLFSLTTAKAFEVSFEEDATLPMVDLDLAIRGGSVNDPKDLQGLSSFMGRMLLRGTQARTKEQIHQALDQIGGKLYIDTRAEMLVIRGSVLSAHVDDYLSILKEVITQPSFPAIEIEKLRSETISEILDEMSQDSSLSQFHFNRFFFGSHPFSYATYGTQKSVQKFNASQLKNQYELLFQDRNMIILGSGDTSSDRIIKWATQVSKLRPNVGKVEAYSMNAPTFPPQLRMAFVDKPDRTQVQFRIGHKGVLFSSDEYFSLNLANTVFGGSTFATRLMKEIRVKTGWSYGAGSNFRFGTQPRSWTISTEVANKDAPAALEKILAMFREFQQNGITPEEFQYAKNVIVRNSGFTYNSPKKRSENKLYESIFRLPDGFMKSYGPQTEKLTLEQVNAAIRKFFDPNQLAIVLLGTEKLSKENLVKAAGLQLKDVPTIPYNQE